MRILQLISSGGPYGAETVVLNLARATGSLGNTSTVGVFWNQHSPHLELADLARERGLAIEVILCRGRVDWKAVRAIRKILQGGSYSVLHTHGYKADLYGFAATRGLPIPILATCHNWTRSKRVRSYAQLDRWVLRRFDGVVAVSEPLVELLADSGVPRERLHLIPNGVDLSDFLAAPATLEKEIGEGTRTLVGVVARLDLSKGLAYFLHAAREVLEMQPETLFVVVGEGPDRQKLEQMSLDLGLADKLVFTGHRNDMPGVYASLDLLVLPSLDEAMPMCILEAMAAGKPVVATMVGEIPRVVRPEQTGLLVDPGNTPRLRDAINELVADPDRRRRMGAQARAVVAEEYSAEIMARRYLTLYEALQKRRPSEEL